MTVPWKEMPGRDYCGVPCCKIQCREGAHIVVKIRDQLSLVLEAFSQHKSKHALDGHTAWRQDQSDEKS